MIFGIGCDIADVSRFEKWVSDSNMYGRFFNPNEFPSDSMRLQRKCEHFASRFAAKEAFNLLRTNLLYTLPIQEGGKVPGQKITLKTKGLVKDPKLKQKSLSKIVSFKSQKHPKATPEVLIIGYWN